MSTFGVAPVRSPVLIPVSTPVNAWLVLSIPVSIPVSMFVDALSMGFNELFGRLACICMGSKGYNLKTRVYSMQVMSPMLKTRVNTRNYLLVLL